MDALPWRARDISDRPRAPINIVAGWSDVVPVSGSTETPCPEKLAIDHAVGRHFMVAFVSANCPSCFRTHDSINGIMIVPGASEPALYLYNQPHIAVSVVVVTVVVVRVVRIRVRIEDGKTKRVDKHKRSMVDPRHMSWRRPRHGGSRHHW